jgi:Protein of unknown function (DUF4246)
LLQVLDLVHPSLFPLVFGTSRRIKVDISHLADEMMPQESISYADEMMPQECPSSNSEGPNYSDVEVVEGPEYSDVEVVEDAEPLAAVEAAVEAVEQDLELQQHDTAVEQDLELQQHDTSMTDLQQHDTCMTEVPIRAAFSNWKRYMGTGEIVCASDYSSEFVSDCFQWLPTDVRVDAQGKVQLMSYINNMHPEWHSALYAATAALIENTIPIFERTLAAAATPKRRVVVATGEYWQPSEWEWCKQKMEEKEAREQKRQERWLQMVSAADNMDSERMHISAHTCSPQGHLLGCARLSIQLQEAIVGVGEPVHSCRRCSIWSSPHSAEQHSIAQHSAG